jgi:DNA-binding GntR family transcriptional regulator
VNVTTDGFQLDSNRTRRITAVDLVRDVLRTAIIRGDLPGGSRLVQTDIAAQLNVSTTPVREAMRDLASEGLITLDSHKIGIVRGPDWDEMVEIVEVRKALEPVALQHVVENITPEELAHARTLADQMAMDSDLGTWVQNNSRFHNIFHRSTRTKRLASMLVTLEEASGVFVAQSQQVHPEIRQRAIKQHFEFLEAIEANDVAKALEIQQSHLQLALESKAMDD